MKISSIKYEVDCCESQEIKHLGMKFWNLSNNYNYGMKGQHFDRDQNPPNVELSLSRKK